MKSTAHLNNPWGLSELQLRAMAYICEHPAKRAAYLAGCKEGAFRDRIKQCHIKMGLSGARAIVAFDRWRVNFIRSQEHLGPQRLDALKRELMYEPV